MLHLIKVSAAAAVPEPASPAMAGLGAMAFLRRRLA